MQRSGTANHPGALTRNASWCGPIVADLGIAIKTYLALFAADLIDCDRRCGSCHQRRLRKHGTYQRYAVRRLETARRIPIRAICAGPAGKVAPYARIFCGPNAATCWPRSSPP